MCAEGPPGLAERPASISFSGARGRTNPLIEDVALQVGPGALSVTVILPSMRRSTLRSVT
jgi:hypothetical protein